MAARETPPVAGKFISDPRCDIKDIEAIIAMALKKDPTTHKKARGSTPQTLCRPRRAVTGERIFDGVPIGSAFNQATGHLYLFKWVFGADQSLEKINFGTDIDIYTAALGPYLNAENPDLSPFEKRGGKLVMMSGSADPIVSYTATLDYYERVIEHFGNLEKVQLFFRFYIVPGMAHGGGPGINSPPDLLEAVKTWREKGTAPEMLYGHHAVKGKNELKMPLYPYPTQTARDAATSTFKPVDGPRGGVERVADRFRPSAAE